MQAALRRYNDDRLIDELPQQRPVVRANMAGAPLNFFITLLQPMACCSV